MGAAAAIGVGAGVSALSNLFSGISASKDAKEAAEAQAQALNRMVDLQNEQLQLYKDELDNFQSVFGSVEQNLKNYYNSLSPDSVAAKDIQNLEVEFNRVNTQLNQQLAQRGLSNSGAAAAANTALASNLATSRAEARSNASQKVANQQLGWYSLGTQQKHAALAGLSGAYGQAMQGQSNLASVYGQQASNAANAATQSFANIGSTITNAIGTSIVANALNGGGSSVTPQTTNSTGATIATANVNPQYWGQSPFSVPQTPIDTSNWGQSPFTLAN